MTASWRTVLRNMRLILTPDCGSPQAWWSQYFRGKMLAQFCHCAVLWVEVEEEEEGWTRERRLPRWRALSTNPWRKETAVSAKIPSACFDTVAFMPRCHVKGQWRGKSSLSWCGRGTYLKGQISIPSDVLGTFNDSKVGEAQLICRLDQAHPVASHLQQHLTNLHRRWVFAMGHLHVTAKKEEKKMIHIKKILT